MDRGEDLIANVSAESLILRVGNEHLLRVGGWE